MNLDWFDENEMFGLSMRFWLIMTIAVVIIIGIAFWIFSPRPPPEIVHGYLDGTYDAKNKFFDGLAPLDPSQCNRPAKCFNNSWIIGSGNLTVQNGAFTRTTRIHNRKMVGFIDIVYRDARILESDTQNHATPIKAYFRGYLEDPFILDGWDMLDKAIIGFLILFIVYIFYIRKIEKDEKDADFAERMFREHCKGKLFKIKDDVDVSTPERAHGFWSWHVGCKEVERPSGDVKPYIVRIYRNGRIDSKAGDDDGLMWDAIFKKPGLDYAREREKAASKYSTADVNQAFEAGRAAAEKEKGLIKKKKKAKEKHVEDQEEQAEEVLSEEEE